jgi:hypothetical protein
MADDDSLLFNIFAGPDDESSSQPVAQGDSSSAYEAADASTTKSGKHLQSEADFIRVKEGYRAKVENGEVCKDPIFSPPCSPRLGANLRISGLSCLPADV